MSRGAALCCNALRWDYSARDAIEDIELSIKAEEATRILTRTDNQKQKEKQK